MAVAIAAQACLPVLRLGLRPLRRLRRHRRAPRRGAGRRREVVDDDGVVHEYDDVLAGEAMEGGPVMLSWRDVSEAGESAEWGYNVVVHEFAHVLDMRDGVADGIPPLAERRRARSAGSDVLTPSTKRFCDARRRRRGHRRSTPTAPKRPRSSSPSPSEAFFVAPQAHARRAPGAVRAARRLLPAGPGTRAPECDGPHGRPVDRDG